ncbi:MAG: molybdopterin molybdotransferase MoeA [Fulvimarina manganoxydans]|uniref:molybdopterin molybdotransferase MoeA n=1 Tax=Fulvimarina manganoxydans TaxID=937218 RepID=UPI0023559C3F|nr:gephyrin-like molybdotransferase Glp [Fulvimarina manganoxydans]MCK5931129.1 molybdopterin molybdotransferase MoeA [Fulvimarina manganoxydans]
MSLMPLEEAYRRVLAGAEPVPRTERVGLRQASGRVLAEPVIAQRTQPGFNASAMDGYAIKAAKADAGSYLKVIGESAAGKGFSGRIEDRQTVRIFTGAPVPEGADTVLIQENAEVIEASTIKVTEAPAQGAHIRLAGVDFAEGQTLLSGGTLLSPGSVALAASGGHPELVVRAKPRVVVLSTGDELVLPGEPVGPHQIVASNTFGIAALCEAAGAEVIANELAPDDEAAIGAVFDRALEAQADIFVTIGGASVGDHDLVGKVFAEKGVDLDFWKVAMRPGKPFMAGAKDGMRIAGLPGNPASSMVAATLFLAPLIRRLAGLADKPLFADGFLAEAMPANGSRADLVRSVIRPGPDGPLLSPLPRQDSSLLSVYAEADALLLRPVNANPAEAGDPCRFVPLS